MTGHHEHAVKSGVSFLLESYGDQLVTNFSASLWRSQWETLCLQYIGKVRRKSFDFKSPFQFSTKYKVSF